MEFESVPVPPRGPRLPEEPWPLTAPESYLLRYGLGKDVQPLPAFKVALMEVVARQALTLEGAWVRRRWMPGRYPTFLLCAGPRRAEIGEGSLRPLVELHADLAGKRLSSGVPFNDSAGEVHGVLLTRFATVAARRDGGFRKYVKRDVAGSLRERRLLAVDNVRTTAGRQANEQLDAWIEVGRRALPLWSRDETWMRAFLTGAGASVFLTQFATPAQPVLKQIGQALASFNSPDLSGAAAAWDAHGLDFAGLADSLDGAFGAIEAGFIGGDGGGGGGDGGGGG